MAARTPSPPPSPEDIKVRMPGHGEAELVRPDEVRRRNVRDLAMLGLGVASLAIVAYDFFYGAGLRGQDRGVLEWVDLGIVLVFLGEFVVRMRAADRKGRFVLQNWFDLVGLVPLMVTSFPLFRALRLLRVFMIASRLLRMWSFFTGERSAQLVFNRYRVALVEEVTDRVMLRSIALVENSLTRGSFPRTMGDSLSQRRQDLAHMAVEASRANDLGKWFAMVPGFESAVRQAALASVDTVIAALRSEEMERTFETTMRELTAELKGQIARKEWREAGLATAAPPSPKGS